MKFFKLQKLGHTNTEVRNPIQPERYSYVIKRLSDGLFSKGGSHPRFGKIGRVWNRATDVKAHIRTVDKKLYEGCIVIEFGLFETKRFPNPEYFYYEGGFNKK